MRPLVLLLVASAVCTSASAQLVRPEKAPGARGIAGGLAIHEANAQFDDRHQFEIIEWQWSVENTGDRLILVEEALALKGDAEVSVSADFLEPGARATIRVRQPLGDALGSTARRYALITSEPGVARYRFSLSGFVESAYDPEAPTLDFGSVGPGSARTVATIASREVDRLVVSPPEQLPPFLAIETAPDPVDPQRAHIEATLTESAPLGIHAGSIQLGTNVSSQPAVAVTYRFSRYKNVVPDSNPLSLGALPSGISATGTFRLTADADFEVAGVEADVEMESLEAQRCEESRTRCWLITFRTPPLAPGPITGQVVVSVSGESETLPLKFFGLGVPEGTEIRTIDTSGGGAR
jgi:hypothetical protein